MRTTDGNPGLTVCKRRMGFSFIAGYQTPVIWPNGLVGRAEGCWCWMIWWKKGDRTNACWICSPKIPIIATSPSCIWRKIYSRLANSPRPSIATRITLWPSRTPGIKRAYGPFYCKPFPTDGVKSCAYLNASRPVPLAIWCWMCIRRRMIGTDCGVI